MELSEILELEAEQAAGFVPVPVDRGVARHLVMIGYCSPAFVHLAFDKKGAGWLCRFLGRSVPRDALAGDGGDPADLIFVTRHQGSRADLQMPHRLFPLVFQQVPNQEIVDQSVVDLTLEQPVQVCRIVPSFDEQRPGRFVDLVPAGITLHRGDPLTGQVGEAPGGDVAPFFPTRISLFSG